MQVSDSENKLSNTTPVSCSKIGINICQNEKLHNAYIPLV